MDCTAADGLNLLERLGLSITYEAEFRRYWSQEFERNRRDLVATTGELYASPPHRHTHHFRLDEFASRLLSHFSELKQEGIDVTNYVRTAFKEVGVAEHQARCDLVKIAERYQKAAQELYQVVL